MNKLRTLAIGSFVGIAVLLVVAAMIGLMMEPSHRVTRHATYASTPEELWRVITRFDQTPAWRSDIEAVQIESGDPIRFVEMGDQGPMPMEVTEQEAPYRLVIMASDFSLPFTGSWTFELEQVEGGTRLSITEQGSIDNPLFRFVAHVFMDPAATANTYLVDLGRHLGQEVEPQAPG
ncbi:MAG: SRPBCC family protein [Myxococcota bacterium]